ncbi:zinc finger and BTB domain-containing protein 4 [Dipodomys spectabilis]|uniref:zinc finger and BTB domain-containing protein 4 n=1 Tax=Dipodomys spectabilis TaxID=105255 RepID=UPI001C542D90|nr:zinc finger and BTB domain-containing protein 4 [Dipodomys spectabilis]XP_042526730.1 zinc finger and BTB domain-containing protein 4 [Dipodomys spectabilis]XP_042526731.1 zinc finger and BTB domain-containing protein 4 [Dipodomys spectabilis]
MPPPAEVTDPSHAPAVLRQLNEQRLRGLFCDVTLIAGDTKFPAHRSVLAASSPFFREALLASAPLALPPVPGGSAPNPTTTTAASSSSSYSSSSSSSSSPPPTSPSASSPPRVLELPGVPAAAFSDVLNFIYSARLALPDGGGDGAAVAEIGALGRRLGISRLQGLGEGGDAWVPPTPAPVATSQPEEDSFHPGPRPDGEWEDDKMETPDSQPPLSRRSLPCPRCGKTFIHPKRLQTHEAQCRRGANSRVSTGLGAGGPGPGGPAGVDASALPSPVSFRGGPEHLVKVVGGHVLYVCAACERSYVTLSSLKRHSNVHSWRRKYPCRYCEKVFALAEYRTKHEVWHTGERRYQCIFCWETFVTYYNLKTHQRAFHGISPGLLASEKTPNGGYKPKLNTLKLYRLLPMRAAKRPYKTYSQGAPEAPLSPRLHPPAPVAMPSSPPPKPPPAPEPGPPPSVITFAHPAPSVIVHGSGGSSSGGGTGGGLASTGGAQAASVITYTAPPRPPKKREYPPPPPEPAATPTRPASTTVSPATAAGPGTATEETKSRNPRAGRTLTYTAKPVGGVGGAGGAAAGTGRGSQLPAPPPLCQITVRIGEEAIVKRRISETDLRPGDLSGEEVDESEEEEEEDEEEEEEDNEEESKASGEDQLWRPYYSYKPKRKAGATSGGSSGGNGIPRSRRPPRWRQKLDRRGWEESPALEVPTGRPRGERRHHCGDCAQTFPNLRKLRKHQEAHSGGSHSSRTGRRPSTRFTCPHCAKVCKTAAALSRHGQRHAAERSGGTPTPVIAYSKGSAGTRPGAVKEEAPQEMQVSSSSGEAGGGSAAAEEAPDTASLQDPVISGGEEPPVAVGGSHGYPPVQEFPLALIGRGREPGSGRGKAGGEGPVGASQGDQMEAAKVTFYPEPYPLVYGPQLLAAYPYNFSNLAALPVALNMVLPDEKGGGALPFLPGVFSYTVNPQAAPPTPPTPPPPILPPSGPPKGEGERAGVDRTQKGDVG